MIFKDSQHIIKYYKQTVLQIATPFSTGTGFYSSKLDVIITNEHVVRDNKRVVVKGKGFSKYMADVLYLDTIYDIALLSPPSEHDMPKLSIQSEQIARVGDSVIAVGHPFGLKYTATSGVISSLDHIQGDVPYIQHDAALNPGNSGGPLINASGEVIGINTFIIKNGNNIGFSLPISHLIETLESYHPTKEGRAIRCNSCRHVIMDIPENNKYCPNCGTRIKLISGIEEYEPNGISKTIEALLTVMDYNPELCRRGLNHWQVSRGSAQIKIAYHEKTGLILADAHICYLPKDNLNELYKYLLKENYSLSGLTFSVQNSNIIISLLMYDQYINAVSTRVLFDKLMEAADKYDNILEDNFGAKIKETRS